MRCACGTEHEGGHCPTCGRGTSGWTIFRILLTVVMGVALIAVAAIASCGITIVIASGTENETGFMIGLGVGVVAFCFLCVMIYRFLRHINRPRDAR